MNTALIGQWLPFAILGGLIVVAYLQRGVSDEEAYGYLHRPGWGMVAAAVALVFFLFGPTFDSRIWGILVGGLVTFAALCLLLPEKQQRWIVGREHFGVVAIIGVVAIMLVAFGLPAVSAGTGTIVLIAALLICVLYLFQKASDGSKMRVTARRLRRVKNRMTDQQVDELIETLQELITTLRIEQSDRRSEAETIVE